MCRRSILRAELLELRSGLDLLMLMNRRRFLRYSGGVAAAGAAGVLGYTFGIEPHWVEIVQRPLPVVACQRSRFLEQLRFRSLLPGRTDQYIGPRQARVDAGHIVEHQVVVPAMEHCPNGLPFGLGAASLRRQDVPQARAGFSVLGRLAEHLAEVRFGQIISLQGHVHPATLVSHRSIAG